PRAPLALGEVEDFGVQLLGDDVAGEVALVRPLHDDDEDAGLRVVETGRKHLVPYPQRVLAHRIRIDVADVVRIVDDDDVAALVGGETAEGRRDTMPAVHRIKAGLSVLVGAEPETLAPAAPIPVGLDELTTTDRVARGERLVVAHVHELHARPLELAGQHAEAVPGPLRIRVLRPHPAREEDVGAERLHVPRRLVDDEPAHLGSRHRLEVVGGRFDVPVGLERVGLDVAPAALNEAKQVALAEPRVELLVLGASLDSVRRRHAEYARPAAAMRALVLVAGLRSGVAASV